MRPGGRPAKRKAWGLFRRRSANIDPNAGLQLGGGIRSLEKRIVFVETLLILLAILAIASGDYLLGKERSIGYLYLIPLSYSALTHQLRTTLGFVVLCVFLRQWLGPLEFSSWGLIIRDWVLTGVFLAVVAALGRLGNERRRFFETARRQRDELLREVELAARVQEHLLEEVDPPTDCFDTSALTVPARIVGGDYYDFFRLSENRVGIVVADISGKGLPAALLMPAVRMVLRTTAEGSASIPRVLQKLNETLLGSTEHASYVTIVYGILDLQSGEFRYANGGHQPALYYKKETGEFFWLETGGPPVGLIGGLSYEEGSISLRAGDLLVLFTDGIVEAEDDSEEQYGLERVQGIVKGNLDKSAKTLVELIHSDVDKFAARESALDDATVIALKVPDGPGGSSDSH